MSNYYICHECDATLQRQSWMSDKEWDEYIEKCLEIHNCNEIFSIQGHDHLTSRKHYQSLSFTDYEMSDIEKRLIEWGILRRRI